jgi:Fe2+ or Zn2+ uptake regulation protein
MNKQLERLKENGYRLTKKRCEIMEALEEGLPLSADDIMAKISRHCKVNLSTIYRNLNCLLKMGLVRKVNSLDQADRYELVKHDCQHALECVKCGATVIFSECIFNQMVQEIESKTNYQVKQHHIEIYGTCPKCKTKN